MEQGYGNVVRYVTNFFPEEDGVWTMAWWNLDLCLVFIKTSNTPNNMVEVHIASGASNYQTRVLELQTAFGCENNGVWCMGFSASDDPPDLIYIKTANTGTGMVEVHIASGSSQYKTRLLEVGTTFYPENDGIWGIGTNNEDLGFIKTTNTGTGNIELHIASRQSNYATRTWETGTGFTLGEQGRWSWMSGPIGLPVLTLIKPTDTASGTVEVYVADGDLNTVIGFTSEFACDDNGYWLRYDTSLVYIKTRNTISGNVEVNIATSTA